MKEHLLHFFPFLKKEFRTITLKEAGDKKVFAELFPNDELDLSKLKAVYLFQQESKNTITVKIDLNAKV